MLSYPSHYSQDTLILIGWAHKLLHLCVERYIVWYGEKCELG